MWADAEETFPPAVKMSCVTSQRERVRGTASSGKVCRDAFDDNATPQHTGDSSQPRPGSVSNEPESRNARIMWNGVLIAVEKRLAHTAHGPSWPVHVALVGVRCSDLADDGILAQCRIHAPGERDELVTNFVFSGLIEVYWQVAPWSQLTMRRDHHRTVTGRSAFKV